MRRFLMPFLLLALLTVLTSCGSSSSAQSNPTGDKLVVFVSGLGAHLSDSDIAQNNGYGFDSAWEGLQTYLQGTSDFQGAQFMAFSYRGFTTDGKPGIYPCQDTFNNQLKDDVARLNLQITQYLKGHPNTDVYIVAHSLGGVIAFSYMAQLIEMTHSNAIIDLGTRLGTLKGIAILDSPLGGVTNTGWYDAATIAIALKCDRLLINYGTIADLQGIFQNASSSVQQGETASIYNYLTGSNGSNQQVASDAANAGVAILIVGNENDLMWQPDVAGLGSNFLSTEFLSELGKMSNNGSLYSRSFTSGQMTSGALFSNLANHMDVLKNQDVWTAIWKVFTGQPLDKLTSVTDSSIATSQPTDQPTQQPTEQPTQQPTPTDTPTPTPTDTSTPTTPTPTPTDTPTPTSTPTDTPTPTPTDTSTPTPTVTPDTSPVPSGFSGIVNPFNGSGQANGSMTISSSVADGNGGYNISGTIVIDAPVSINASYTGTIDSSGNMTFTFSSGGSTWKFDTGTNMEKDVNGQYSNPTGNYYVDGNPAGSWDF